MYCPNCKKEVGENARFCKKCGTKTIWRKYCINCGKPLEKGMAFCPACGQAVIRNAIEQNYGSLPYSVMQSVEMGQKELDPIAQTEIKKSADPSSTADRKLSVGAILIVVILAILIGIIPYIDNSSGGGSDSYGGESSSVTEAFFPPDGVPVSDYMVGEYEELLTAGEYTVGKDIPAGIYVVSLESEDDGEIDLLQSDDVNGIYEFLVFSHENSDEDYQVETWDGLVLMEGGSFRLEGKGTLHFSCEEAYYTETWTQMENTQDTVYTLEDTMKVGVDIEPGVYDVVLETGDGSLHVQRTEEDEFYLYFSEDSPYDNKEFRSLDLPEGTILTAEYYDEDSRILLRPSEFMYESEQ